VARTDAEACEILIEVDEEHLGTHWVDTS